MSSKSGARRVPRVDDALMESNAVADEADLTDVLVEGDFSGRELQLISMRQCRIEGASFIGSRLVRASLVDCNLVESDFYGAKLPGSRIRNSDLGKADLATSDLAGTRMLGSNLTDVRGGESLRGVTLSSDQIIPAALAVFASMKIRIDDEEEPTGPSPDRGTPA